MVLLAQMVVEYAADTSKLQAGVTAAAKTQKMMQDATISATNSMSSGFKNATSSIQPLIAQAEAAGLNVSKLAAAQAKAGEASAKLGVAQSQAAVALQKASDMASSGKASAEKIAVAQAQAALAAEKVNVAETAAGAAMQKVSAEASKLSSALNEDTVKSTALATAETKAAAETKALSSALQNTAPAATALAAKAEVASVSLGHVESKARLTVPPVAALVAAFAALAAALAAPTDKAMEFQATLLKINALAGLSKEEVTKAGDALLLMSARVGKGPLDLAEGLYYVASAGYGASAGMDILERSAKQAAVGMTETQVVANAATAVLRVFPALSTAQAFDVMTASVSAGKTEWKDYAPSIGKVALFASQAGISFQEATSALSALTNTMPSTEQASTSLIALLQTSSRFSELGDRAKSMGIAFNESSYKTMNLVERLRYLQQITHGNAEAINKLLGQEEAVPAITALMTNGAQDYLKVLDGITHSSGAAEAAFQKTSAGARAAIDKMKAAFESLVVVVGTLFLPVVGAVANAATPVIAAFTAWLISGRAVSDVVKFISNNAQIMIPVLSGVGAIIASLLIPVLISLAGAALGAAAGFIAFAAPLVLLGAAVAGLVVAFMHLYQTSAPFRASIDNITTSLRNAWNVIQSNFLPVMQQIGNIIQSQVLPVLTQFGDKISSTLTEFGNWIGSGQALRDVMAALQPVIDTLGPPLTQLGNALSNIGKNIADAAVNVYNWVTSGHAMDDIVKQLQPIIAYLAPLVAQLGTAFANLGTALLPLIAGSGPFIANLSQIIGQFGQWLVSSGVLNGIVTGLVVGIGFFVQVLTFLVNGLANVITFFTTGGSNAKVLWDILVGVGAFLASTFKPVWDQLVATWQTQLMPAVSQLIAAFQVAMPILQSLGAIITGVVVIAIGLVISVIGGLLGALAGALPGIIQVFGGIVQIISGAIQIALGIIQFFVDLFTGNFSRLGADLGVIWQGVATMFSGVWNIIAGLFSAFIGMVSGFVSGFITTIIGFFTHLWDMLVGHSIIPDMINGIFDWFAKLPGKVGEFIGNMVTTALNKFNEFLTKCLEFGSNIAKNIGEGISNAIHFVQDAVNNVTKFISDHLPHSPAKLGPLRDLHYQGGQIIDQISRGMMAGLPQLESAIGDVTKPIALNLSGKRLAPIQTSTRSSRASSMPIVVHVNVINDQPVYVGNEKVTDVVMSKVIKEVRKGPIR